jgi:D-sedoheptulose 7-phosphate isomerase
MEQAVDFIKPSRRIFFIGNGGSNSICSHMMQDYAKIGGFQTFSFSDPSLITCFANDYGYENAVKEWLKIYYQKEDILVAISSSGQSKNILNAVDHVDSMNGKVITLSGFKKDNLLQSRGKINFHIPEENFGIVECFHQVILHVILDELSSNK